MKMLSDNRLEAVCSVTALAKKLGLSRARFYQLQAMGVFPEPVRSFGAKRPFYPLELQQRCIEIRRTGIGLDGRPVRFNAARRTKPDKPEKPSYDEYEELVDILKEMGLSVSRSRVRDAIEALYPKGLAEGPVERTVIHP
jgi:hypothetical protein